MIQLGKVRATSPETLSSIPGIPMAEGNPATCPLTSARASSHTKGERERVKDRQTDKDKQNKIDMENKNMSKIF